MHSAEIVNNEQTKMIKAIALEVARLSASRLVTTSGISIMCGLGENSNTVHRIIRDPSFPRPIQLCEGGRKRWLRSEVEAWIEEKYALAR